MNRFVDRFVRFFMHWIPDSFVIAILLRLVTFVLAVGDQWTNLIQPLTIVPITLSMKSV